MQKEETLIAESRLRDFTEQTFLQMGLNLSDAQLAADVLIASDLRGIDSHGVARLSGYVRLWQAGRINPNPRISIVHETPSTAVVDGDAGLGLVVAPRAMEIAMEKARNVGTGWVAVRNSNHFGICAYHTLMAARKNMIGLAMTNASPLVAPAGSTERMLGTNPVCYAFPAGDREPVVMDMATAAAANGKLEIAQRLEKPIPEGWVQTETGEASNDAHALKKGGSLLPLGSDADHGYHKGFCLASAVDLLSAVLSGANYGPWVPPFVSFLPLAPDMPGLGIGHFLGAMRVDAFRPVEDYTTHIHRWMDTMKAAKPVHANQPVIIPGTPEVVATLKRKTGGIPLNEAVWNDLKQLAGDLGIQPL